MPGKTEHVLFCRVTDRERAMYEAHLQSDEVARVMRNSSTKLFAAVTMLRKIWNHPDLVCEPNQSSSENFRQNSGNQSPQINGKDSDRDDDDDFNDFLSDFNDQMDSDKTIEHRSGKLEVLSKILPIWHKQGTLGFDFFALGSAVTYNDMLKIVMVSAPDVNKSHVANVLPLGL